MGIGAPSGKKRVSDQPHRGRRGRHLPISHDKDNAIAPRCPLAEVRCRSEVPRLRAVGGDRLAACHLA
jgi:hypothetical protein